MMPREALGRYSRAAATVTEAVLLVSSCTPAEPPVWLARSLRFPQPPPDYHQLNPEHVTSPWPHVWGHLGCFLWVGLGRVFWNQAARPGSCQAALMIVVCLTQVGGLGRHTLCPRGMLSQRVQLCDTLLPCSMTLRILFVLPDEARISHLPGVCLFLPTDGAQQ